MRDLLLLLALAVGARADVVEDLLSDDEAVRQEAAASVRASGPGAVPVARALARRLDGTDPRARVAAARGLAALEVHAMAALPALIDATGAKAIDVEVAALDAIAAIGPAAREAVPALVAALRRDEPRGRHGAAHALWRLEAAAAPAEEALAVAIGGGGRTALFAAYALGNFAAERPATRVALVDALRADDPELRTAAAKALHGMGERAREAAPALRAALKDPAQYVRGWACYALGAVKGDGAAAVAAFRPLFADGSAWVRRAVCAASGDLAEAGQALEPELLGAARDDASEVRLAAWTTLEKLFPGNAEYAAAQDRAHRAHFAAVDEKDRREVLARFGNDVARAVRGLTTRLRDGNANQRALAAWHLKDLARDAAAAIPALTAALRDPDGDVRYAALAALEDIGLPPVQELFPLLEDGHDQLRWNAQALLREHRAEIEALLKDPETKAAAERVLGLLRDRK